MCVWTCGRKPRRNALPRKTTPSATACCEVSHFSFCHILWDSKDPLSGAKCVEVFLCFIFCTVYSPSLCFFLSLFTFVFIDNITGISSIHMPEGVLGNSEHSSSGKASGRWTMIIHKYMLKYPIMFLRVTILLICMTIYFRWPHCDCSPCFMQSSFFIFYFHSFFSSFFRWLIARHRC